tara:strand:+ start:1637 stop:1894 length:258 start_codon:yes stop_codon:yes gene_type:complete
MARIQDPDYVKICAQLASELSISLASARRCVDQAAARAGSKDLEQRKSLAREMLEAAKAESGGQGTRLDQLLSSSEGDDNFLLED